ncbi:TetR/AcrR family transcriptional regulator [Kitasatospora sp. NPDC090091]|uniref:TetR/AcrR family transcriptional regulator n=1 Tax=Kitasatospora sp. NPDC090091 TaxID=3364081 RepID=UPI0038180D26
MTTARVGTPPPALTRRERTRLATITEMMSVARRLLAEDGEHAVTIRAIAREMGMTAPAVYRYFESHEVLVREVRKDIFTEVSQAIRSAADSRADRSDAIGRLLAAGRALRHWALAHRHEFALILGTSPLSSRAAHDDETQNAGWLLGSAFAALMAELWLQKPFPVPPDEQLPAGLRDQLDSLRAKHGVNLPAAAIAAMLGAWARLHGLICLEVLGHLTFALPDAGDLFEYELARLSAELGWADGYRAP